MVCVLCAQARVYPEQRKGTRFLMWKKCMPSTPLDLISKVPKHIHYVRSFVLDSDTATTNYRLSSNFAVIKFIGLKAT